MAQQETPVTDNSSNPSFSSPDPVFRSATMTTGNRDNYRDTPTHLYISEGKQTERTVVCTGWKGPVLTRGMRTNVSLSEREPTTEEAVVKMGWKDPVLTCVPCFYPLSQTHIIFPKSDLKFILERLVYAFRLLSLHTTFYDAPSVRAYCRSMEQVEFAVNIWECRNKPDFIVLEIQRTSGDTIIYYKHVERIFSEISRKDEVTVADDESIETSAFAARASMDAIMRSLPSLPDNIVQQTLDIVLKMLLSNRRDSRHLGLESLVILTDTSKTHIAVATDVAKALLLGFYENNGETLLIDQRIQERILHLVLFRKWPDSTAGELCCDEGLHVHLALTAMANAINLLLQTSPELLSLVLDAASHMGGEDFLINSMEKYIWGAQNNPHAAYLAARVLTSVYRVEPTRIHCGLQLDAVRAAHQIGRCSHAALEMVTEQLLSALKA